MILLLPQRGEKIQNLFLQKVVNNESAQFSDQTGIFQVEVMSAHCRELRNT